MFADGVVAACRILLKLGIALRAGDHRLADINVVLGVVIVRRVRGCADDERGQPRWA
jgi:hypothetical protein